MEGLLLHSVTNSLTSSTGATLTFDDEYAYLMDSGETSDATCMSNLTPRSRSPTRRFTTTSVPKDQLIRHDMGALTLTRVLFESNDISYHRGLVMCGNDDTSIIIDDSTFQNNKGVSVRFDGGSIGITNAQFQWNSHSEKGGAIKAYTISGMQYTPTLTISYSTFKSNTAGEYGGAIAMEESNMAAVLTIEGVTFDSNKDSVGADSATANIYVSDGGGSYSADTP